MTLEGKKAVGIVLVPKEERGCKVLQRRQLCEFIILSMSCPCQLFCNFP
jgi:hypothetical protein